MMKIQSLSLHHDRVTIHGSSGVPVIDGGPRCWVRQNYCVSAPPICIESKPLRNQSLRIVATSAARLEDVSRTCMMWGPLLRDSVLVEGDGSRYEKE